MVMWHVQAAKQRAQHITHKRGQEPSLHACEVASSSWQLISFIRKRKGMRIQLTTVIQHMQLHTRIWQGLEPCMASTRACMLARVHLQACMHLQACGGMRHAMHAFIHPH